MNESKQKNINESNQNISGNATLGCGSLIIIILIVMLFGNSGSKRVQEDVQSLNQRIEHLEQKIDNQTEQIRLLSEALIPAGVPNLPSATE